MTGLAAFRSRFSWLDRWTLGVLVLWVAWAAVALACRWAWLAALPRTVFATLFAPLSHRLRNGFFFSQGLDIADSSCRPQDGPGLAISCGISSRTSPAGPQEDKSGESRST